MRKTVSAVLLPPAIATLCCSFALLALAPNGANAQQGQNPGAITESPPSKTPTLATMSRFAGTWACASVPARRTYTAIGAMSPQGNAFAIISPAWRSLFTSSGGVLQLRRSDAAGEATPYAFAGYVPHAIDLTFESTLPSERAGATPENTFAHTFEIKRYRSGFVITKKSPKFGTVTETCKAS